MESKAFAKPIYLKDGTLVREITNVEDAIDFLMEWPESKRDVLHEATVRTCIMAHDGLKPVKIARDALRAFAVKKGILERQAAVKPWMIKPGSGGRAHA
ncbi:DUF982 domain-containing protein [Aliihoeflea sp. 40Bstr573]|uniref:DUF982 domain-containing protein n=1 Tax=Aliihoeflea sp. 40Bstr573 TaxID=2696467 RepID=UPI0020947B51|nr:DUF982 domain-containing protein [Aliihoeflea sp. 40Bstr573]MCO6388421.1 DUF982 domain-containing protein [Aliihoeflea sp. 40Bstr573]